MKNKTQELAVALDEFASVQKSHAAFLKKGRLKTLPGWREERKKAFLRLQQCLDRFEPQSVPEERKIVGQVLQKIADIMDDEKSLAALVGSQREKVQEKLRAVRKGKKVVKGYSMYSGTGPKPRYLSSKT